MPEWSQKHNRSEDGLNVAPDTASNDAEAEEGEEDLSNSVPCLSMLITQSVYQENGESVC
jgi:hypothetical protein